MTYRSLVAALAAVALTVTCVVTLTPTISRATGLNAAGRASTAASADPTLHNRCKRSRIDVPSCGVLWGMYLKPGPAKPQWVGHYPAVERKIGRRLDIVKRYVDWQHGVTFPDTSDKRMAAGGKRILDFSWNSVNYDSGKLIGWKSIASGRWDKSVIRPEARRLKTFHHKVFLDFDHEFDSAMDAHLGSPAEFAKAYRHIYRVMHRLHVHNVVWTWVVTGYLGNLKKDKAGYPGARYVDWIGYDPYNFAQCHKAAWQSPATTIAPFYRWLRKQHGMKHKPFLLAEYSSAFGPKVQGWYARIASTLRHLPRIKAVMQWSAKVSSACDYVLTSNRAAMRGFIASSHSRYVLGR